MSDLFALAIRPTFDVERGIDPIPKVLLTEGSSHDAMLQTIDILKGHVRHSYMDALAFYAELGGQARPVNTVWLAAIAWTEGRTDFPEWAASEAKWFMSVTQRQNPGWWEQLHRYMAE